MQGYIVKVVSVMDVGQGKVIPGTGLAEFHSKYQAIVLKPVCGERLSCSLADHAAVQGRGNGRADHQREQDGLFLRGGPAERVRVVPPAADRLQVPAGLEPARVHFAVGRA